MRIVRRLLVGALTGAMLVGSVWAGAGLRPVAEDLARTTAPAKAAAATDVRAAADADPFALPDASGLGPDELLVGAAKVDLKPRPNDYNGTWVRDWDQCATFTPEGAQGALTHVADWRSPWIENTNCIYMGGFGIGPMQPVVEWDDYDPSKPAGEPLGYGLWVRSVAFLRPDSSGAMKSIVLTLIDGEGYFGDYDRMCPADFAECGAHAMAKRLAADTGLAEESFVFASTHAHSAMDFIGGWGGVPPWYMKQLAESLLASAKAAIEGARPATLQAGEALARGLNSERRDTYHSAEDPTLNWIRAVDATGATIATVGTFAAHPTSFGGSATRAHADWHGVFAKRVEERFGGIGLAFPAGLGNMSTRGGAMMGKPLGDLVPASGTLVTNPRVRIAETFWDQPVTNAPLGTLGSAGFFDRPFSGPAAVTAGKSAKQCVSSSPVGVRVATTAARIGDGIAITAAPGEIFSNFSNTIEERATITALAIGQADDALGYLPQQFETDYAAREGIGFADDNVVNGGFFEYEDAYSIDHCFGEKALAEQLRMLAALR